MGPLVIISVIGGLILLASAILLIFILVRSHFGASEQSEPLGYAIAVNPPVRVPPALNGFGLWTAIVLVLMILTYGYPIGQFFFLKQHSVPAILVTGGSDSGGRL
jgi:cytochrome c oxidase subunit 1